MRLFWSKIKAKTPIKHARLYGTSPVFALQEMNLRERGHAERTITCFKYIRYSTAILTLIRGLGKDGFCKRKVVNQNQIWIRFLFTDKHLHCYFPTPNSKQTLKTEKLTRQSYTLSSKRMLCLVCRSCLPNTVPEKKGFLETR